MITEMHHTIAFGCPSCGNLHERMLSAVQCCAIPTELREKMIAEALGKHSYISTCSGRDNLDDSFTVQANDDGLRQAVLWYNAPNGSTHVIVEEI